MLSTIALHDLNENLELTNSILILGIGFDIRCLTILKNIPSNNSVKVLGLMNLQSKEWSEKNKLEFEELLQNKGIIIGNEATNIMQILDALSKEIDTSSFDKIVVDISVLSRELLLSVLAILDSKNLLDKTVFLNLLVHSYGDWLTNGVSNVRSVLGFSGILYPSKRLHLIVIAGFEVERAHHIIQELSPSKVTIGYSPIQDSVDPILADKNKRSALKIQQLIIETKESISDVQIIELSCIDPFLLCNQLETLIQDSNKSEEFNSIIAPLNTKTSTIGAGLYALKHPEIQVCYAEVEQYNYDYANPSDQVIKFSI